MEVTRSNFKKVLPTVEKSIKEADFLVIDTEFTGLINGREVTMFDTPKEYYTRSMVGSADFLLIQFGLCAFRWNEKTNLYINEAYNFYLFPRSVRPGPDRMFLCQSSCLEFLASQGFDFNKLFKEGIPYLTEPMEQKMREALTERHRNYSIERDIIKIPKEHKEQIEEICKRVKDFIDENKSNEMEIDKCNAFVRRLLFQELGLRFKDQVFVEAAVLENKSRIIKVTRVTSEHELVDRDALKKEKDWEELEDCVGFSKVARMISTSAKLVIGHNMLLDVLHTLNHFFQPLPTDYSEFKEFAHCMLPRLLDTKYMSSLPPFKEKITSSMLCHLLATLSEPPFRLPNVESEPGKGYSGSELKEHEAGYDAYITGLCFLSMCDHLAHMRGDSHVRLTHDSPVLKPFINKLFLAKTAHQDSPFINLAGRDPTPSRDHVFHMTFPKDWQRNEINQLFSPFGNITIQFLDETTALVALLRKEQARDVLRVLSKNKKTVLVPYKKYILTKDRQDKIVQSDKQWRKPKEDSTSIASLQSHQKSPLSSPVISETTVPVGNANEPVDLGVPVERKRSLSGSDGSPLKPRKRTSSGMFQIENCEPPPKKMDLSNERTQSDNERQNNKNVIEIFDCTNNVKISTVNAFEESGNWD